MRITRLVLKQWGPHKDLDLDMDTPVYGLLGPNGSGKSNIMEAIAFAFTGMLTRNQATYVRTVSGEDIANGSVDLYFLKGGIRGRIFRQVGKSPSRKLWWEDWKNPITKAAEIDRLMSQILDCDKKAIDQAVFLSQGHLSDWLTSLPAKREEDFARMCTVDNLALVSDIAAQESLRLQKTVTDLTSQRDEATLAREQAEAALRTAEGELELQTDRQQELKWVGERLAASREFDRGEREGQVHLAALQSAKEQRAAVISPEFLPPGENPQAYLDRLREQLATSTQAGQLAAAARTELGTRRSAAAGVTEGQASLAAILAKAPRLLAVQQRQAELTASLAAITEYQALLQRHEQWQVRRDQAMGDVANGEQAVAGLRPFTDVDAELVRNQLQALEPKRLKLHLAAEVAGLWSSESVPSCCPLCDGQDLSHLPLGPELEGMLEVLRQEEEQLRARLQDVEQELARHRTWGAKLDTYRDQLRIIMEDSPPVWPEPAPDVNLKDSLLDEQRQLSIEQGNLQAEMLSVPRIQAEIARLGQQLAACMPEDILLEKIQANDRLAAETPVLRQQVDSLTAYIAALVRHEENVNSCRTRLEQNRQAVEEAQSRLRSLWLLRPKTLQLQETDGETTLSAALNDLTARQAERERAQGMVRANADALRRAEHRISEIEERARKNAATMSVIGHLEDLRLAFGRGGIPRHYLSKVFDALVGLTQENLSEWDTEFQVEKDDANLFNFLFYRTDDPMTLLDQSQLSGGQRTRLALSFVQAVQRLLYPGLDFLSLDEPGADLDAEGDEGMVRLFQTIANQNEEGEAQIIVVTHKPLLNRAFGKSHTLTKINQ